MNYKLEKFWNTSIPFFSAIVAKWTINLKSFEIHFQASTNIEIVSMKYKLEKFWNTRLNNFEEVKEKMNYKLEKFWNLFFSKNDELIAGMNYKLEKFWNGLKIIFETFLFLWTINLKSFEIKESFTMV